MGTDDNYVACLRAGVGNPLLVAGSTKETCSHCGVEVWISPATKEIARSMAAKVVCLECASVLAAQDPDPIVVIKPEQIDEAKEAIRDDIARN